MRRVMIYCVSHQMGGHRTSSKVASSRRISCHICQLYLRVNLACDSRRVSNGLPKLLVTVETKLAAGRWWFYAYFDSCPAGPGLIVAEVTCTGSSQRRLKHTKESSTATGPRTKPTYRRFRVAAPIQRSTLQRSRPTCAQRTLALQSGRRAWKDWRRMSCVDDHDVVGGDGEDTRLRRIEMWNRALTTFLGIGDISEAWRQALWTHDGGDTMSACNLSAMAS